jgi:hypothetical protein
VLLALQEILARRVRWDQLAPKGNRVSKATWVLQDHRETWAQQVRQVRLVLKGHKAKLGRRDLQALREKQVLKARLVHRVRQVHRVMKDQLALLESTAT